MNINKQMIEIATQGDAAWFETHPDNRIRIRNAVDGEFNEVFGQAPIGMSWRAIVLEAQPGMRMRQPVALPLHVENNLNDQDLSALFMQAAGPEAKDIISRLRKVNPRSVPKPASAS